MRFRYQVILDEFTGLELPTDKLDLFDVEHQTECLLFNSRLLNEFDTLINDIDFIRKHIDRFHNGDGTPPDDAALQSARQNCVAIVDMLTKSISACTKDATLCEHFTQAPEDFSNTLPILRLPQPGVQKVPPLAGFKAVNFADPLRFSRNQVLVDLLAADGFYFVIDNPQVLSFGVLGSPPLPNAGTITTQTPEKNAIVPKGTIIHVVVSPLQENPGPTV